MCIYVHTYIYVYIFDSFLVVNDSYVHTYIMYTYILARIYIYASVYIFICI